MTGLDTILRRLDSLRRSVEAMERTAHLHNSSIEDGSLDAYRDGVQTMQIGTQYDGTSIAASVTGPVPPTTTAPVALGTYAGAMVNWDGRYVDSTGTLDESIVAPMDFTRVEIHAATDPDFDALTADTIVGTFDSPRGGVTTVPLATPDEYTIKFVVRTLSGNRSVVSAPDTVTAKPVQIEVVAPPDVSPSFKVQGNETGLLVITEATDPSTLLDIYIDGVLVMPNERSNIVFVDRNSTGDAMNNDDPATLYQVEVQAHNSYGDANGSNPARSGPVTGQRDLNQPDEEYIATLITNVVQTRSLRIGTYMTLGQDGFKIVGADGTVLVSLPASDTSQPNFFSGAIQTTSLRVLGGTSIESTNNEIARGASIVLNRGVTAPIEQIQLLNVYDTVHFDTTTECFGYLLDGTRSSLGKKAFNPGNVTAMAYDGSRWIVATNISGGARIWHFNVDGTIYFANGRYQVDDIEAWKVYGVAQRPDSFAYSFLGLAGGQWYISGQPGAVGSPGGGYFNKVSLVGPSGQTPALSWDNTRGVYNIVENSGDGTRKVIVRRVTVNSYTGTTIPAATVTAVTTLAASSGRGSSLVFGRVGSFDFGSEKVAYLGAGTQRVGVAPYSNGSDEETATNSFPNPMLDMQAMDWDGSNFWALGGDGTAYKLDTWTWTDSNAYLHARPTLYDSDPNGTGPSGAAYHETALGGNTALLRVKRAKVTALMPGVSDKGGVDDPDRFRLYVALATTNAVPANSAYRLQVTGVNPTDPNLRTLVTLTGFNASGQAHTEVPFPDVNPALIYSAAVDTNGVPLTKFLGNGDYRLGGKNLDDIPETSLASISSMSTLTYRVKNGWVYVKAVGTPTTNSGTILTVSTANLPAALIPALGQQGPGNFNGYAGVVQVTSNGAVTIIQTTGASRTAVTGQVTYPLP